jgi:nucleoside-diphosphate-sugar epimerase
VLNRKGALVVARKVLVTGANGFTGSYLCKNLLRRGDHVRALVRRKANLSLLKDVDVEYAYADLGNGEPLDAALKDVEVVFHIAALYRTEGVPKRAFYEVNVDGTERLLKAAKAAGVSRFVHCSTVGVQGEIKNPPAAETARYNPGDHYQLSKMEGELLAKRFFREQKLPGSIVRPAGIYGPGDTRFFKLFNFIYNGKFRMIGSGTVLYQMTYVEDLVEGIALAGEKKEALNEIFTLAGEEYVPLSDLVQRISKILDKPVSRKSIPAWPVWLGGLLCEMVCKPLRIEPPLHRRRLDFFTKDRAFDISKAKKLLGYQPQVQLDEGLRRTAQWYAEHGWFNGRAGA